MAKLLKLRRGTTTQHGSFTGAEGEVTIDTTKDTAVVHDGSTQGGRPLLREDVSNLPDQSIQLNHLPHGTSSNNGKFLRANNGADPTYEVVNTDLVADTSPQLGGDLASNGNDILLADNDFLKVGTGNDLTLSHNGTNSFISNNTGELQFQADDFRFYTSGASETHAKFINNGAVELYHNNVKKFETVSGGATITGTCTATAFAGDGSSLTGISAGATGGGSDEIFYENGQNVTTDYTITNGKNAMSAGPITIDSGVTVTVGAGETLTIV